MDDAKRGDHKKIRELIMDASLEKNINMNPKIIGRNTQKSLWGTVEHVTPSFRSELKGKGYRFSKRENGTFIEKPRR